MNKQGTQLCYPTCEYLSPTERSQTKEKEEHICTKFNKRVYHLSVHPNLVALSECDEPTIAAMPEFGFRNKKSRIWDV